MEEQFGMNFTSYLEENTNSLLNNRLTMKDTVWKLSFHFGLFSVFVTYTAV